MTLNLVFIISGTILFFAVHLAVMARAILRPHREPASRIAWLVVMIVLPGVGIVAYLLLGETKIGRRRVERMRTVLARIPDVSEIPGMEADFRKTRYPRSLRPTFPGRAFGQRLRAGWR